METFHKSSGGSEGDTAVGETVEIKIKTLDSQSYTLRVEKNVSFLQTGMFLTVIFHNSYLEHLVFNVLFLMLIR